MEYVINNETRKDGQMKKKRKLWRLPILIPKIQRYTIIWKIKITLMNAYDFLDNIDSKFYYLHIENM